MTLYYRMEQHLNIPSRPSFVSVMGSVYSPGSFLYEPDQKLDFYLDKSGGSSYLQMKSICIFSRPMERLSPWVRHRVFFLKSIILCLYPGIPLWYLKIWKGFPILKKLGNISDIFV